jgi:hypothetical protein
MTNTVRQIFEIFLVFENTKVILWDVLHIVNKFLYGFHLADWGVLFHGCVILNKLLPQSEL